MTSATISISPCPFCGMAEMKYDTNARDYIDVQPASIDGALHVNMDGFGWYWVMCGKCNAQGPKYHGGIDWNHGNTGPKNLRRDPGKTAKAIRTAVEAWNVRAQPTLF